ncbi:MAG: ABC transporter ATP-binding protein [Lentisphaeria bacterium]|jgi:ATP-binding cassette subfamily B protein
MNHRPKTLLENAYRQESPARSLLRLLEGQRTAFLRMLAMNLVKSSPIWVMPICTANIINVITYPERHESWELWLNGAIVLAFLFQNLVTHVWFQRLLSTILRNIEVNLRSALVRRIQHLSLAFLDTTESGRLQSKVLRDVENVQIFYSNLVVNVFISLAGLAVACGVTLSRRPAMVLFFLLIVPLCVFLVQHFRKPLAKVNRMYRLHMERMSSRVIEMLDMLPVTRAHGVEETEIARMDLRLASVRRSGLRVDVLNAIFGCSAWVTFNSFQVAFFLLCAWLAYHGDLQILGWNLFPGRMPVGDVILYQSFFAMIVGNVNSILNVYPMLTKGADSMRSIGEVLECPDIERNAGKRLVPKVAGGFRLEQLSYTYPGAAQPALHDLDLEIPPGECVAVIGGSGSGKSTLMSLLIGFRRPTAGRILLDGQDMETLDLRQYRRFLAVVPQNTLLFKGTIRDNITYGLSDVTEAQLQAAVEMANCAEFIRQLPQGLDTPLGEHGGSLSGGQRQRLSIARAIIRDPRVIILDEATSALDVAAEKQVQEAIARLVEGRTTFIVAHRFSTIRIASRILVMKEGRCVEAGSAAELLARGGEFQRLHNLQA